MNHTTSPTIYPRFLPVGDAALSVEFGDAIDPAINAKVVALDLALAVAEVKGIVETMPTYRSLMISYDVFETGFAQIVSQLRGLIGQLPEHASDTGRVWTIPVAYGGAYGDDLVEVAGRLGLTPDEVVDLHSSADYLVYLVGFHPGTPNLGGLPRPLHISRRKLPRPNVPASSVAIGGMQSGITSIPSPTGWYVLGRTPIRPFDLRRDTPFLFQPGDRVRFRPIGPEEFRYLEASPVQPDELTSFVGLP